MERERIYQIVGVVILVLLLIGVVALVNSGGQVDLQDLFGGKKQQIEQPVQQPAPAPYVPKDGVITQVVIPIEQQADEVIDITSAGFSPEEINVTRGTSVLWTNRDKSAHWVYGPSYPDRGGCGSKFDSCVGLKLGENFRITFNRAGIWDYSDKLNPQFTGKVIVQ